MSENYINASLNTQEVEENIFKDRDPFGKSWDTLKDFRGIDANFKRR